MQAQWPNRQSEPTFRSAAERATGAEIKYLVRAQTKHPEHSRRRYPHRNPHEPRDWPSKGGRLPRWRGPDRKGKHEVPRMSAQREKARERTRGEKESGRTNANQ